MTPKRAVAPEREALERVRAHVLAKLRKLEHGEHQRVAELAGVSTTHFSNWVRGESEFNPKLEALVGLATALRTPLGALLWTEHDDPPVSAAELASLAQELRSVAHRLEGRRPAAPAQAGEALDATRAGVEKAERVGRKARMRPAEGDEGS